VRLGLSDGHLLHGGRYDLTVPRQHAPPDEPPMEMSRFPPLRAVSLKAATGSKRRSHHARLCQA
jgi:hypothetical protein